MAGLLTGARRNGQRRLAGVTQTVTVLAMTPLLAIALLHRIVFVGDSLTDGSAWTDWVAATLRAHGHPQLRMFDAGVAGNKIGQVKARYAADVLAHNPDLVVLTIGTNDTQPADGYRADLEAILRQTKAKMVLGAPPLVRDPKKNAHLQTYRDVMRELAGKYGCEFVDFGASFRDGDLGPDGIHHTIEGWRRLGRGVLDALGCRAEMLEQVSLYPGTVTGWKISAPLPWKTGQPYPPLPEAWTDYRPHTPSWWQASWLARGAVMPLGNDAASTTTGAYGLAIVKADKETTTTLRVGGAVPYAVWLNGQLVWECKASHGYHPDSDRFPVTLRPGQNRIVAFGTWMFHVALDE